MLKHPVQTKGRLDRFATELRDQLYPLNAAVTHLSVYSAPDRISWHEMLKGKFRPAQIGEVFGPSWSTHWFRVQYAIPQEWHGEEVLLHFDSSSEGCVWQDGVPLQGLTNFALGPQDIRSYYRITSHAKGGENGELYIETAINGLFGLGDGTNYIKNDSLGLLRHARLVVRDRYTWNLLWDFVILKELSEQLPASGPHQGHALAAANEIANAVILDEKSTYAAGHKIAQKFFANHNGNYNHHVSAIGHAHIDTAWLWPLAETRRKCYRTFSTAVRMMEDYPEYKFACSQAQQLAWIKEDHPALFAKIKAKVASGQFIPVGGSWVEPDCNLPNGESLARQFLFGQRFFKKEFGYYCREFWNPDVFGYSGALPQIMQGAKVEAFLTQKLSWSQFNPPANSTFLWEGIDGSRIITHFPPSDTYNAMASVEEILRHYTNFKDSERATESLMLFGFGDGGGGPTEEMLERLRRVKDIAGLPDVTIRSSNAFFDRCREDLADPLVWSGELYLEAHRGTYTTLAAVKRDNRRSEEALHDVEFLAALAWQTERASYPHNEINLLWEKVLLNQFHDIIPGSSIPEVYHDSAKDYAKILKTSAALKRRALDHLFPRQAFPKSNLLVLNTLSWPRREVIHLPQDTQYSFVEAPAYGYAITSPKQITDTPVHLETSDNGFTLENGIVHVSFDRLGRITGFLDKRFSREITPAGAKGNQFVLFDDLPAKWDAWDVDIYHLEKRRNVEELVATRIVQTHPLRATVEVELVISPKARLIQQISLSAESPRLDFAATVDWQEKNQFLKVEFPLRLRCDYATYEIQFGHVRRPTHFNTTRDMAQFEVSAHRWADLSESDYGIALLNDSKYGYACHGNVLRLSILRSSKAPHSMADMGRHSFRYALFPHSNGPQTGGVASEAAAFNQPLQSYPISADLGQASYFSLDNRAVVLDTVKKAEDSDDLILRLYETNGTHVSTTLTTAFTIREAAVVNLLEEDISPLDVSSHQIKLDLRPFEIVSVRLRGMA